jgi:hypothetical protein
VRTNKAVAGKLESDLGFHGLGGLVGKRNKQGAATERKVFVW